MKKSLFFVFVFSLLAGSAQKPSEGNVAKPRIDTVVIVKQVTNDSVLLNYQQILEKTNNQLSLWTNPYGILIGILGVLITILGIGVAFVIYKQSKDAKDLIKESLSKHENELAKLIAEKNSYFANIELSLNKSIEEYQEKLSTPLNEDQKSQITQFITTLQEQKDFIDLKTHTHSGYASQDIPENHEVIESTLFYAKIKLNKVGQSFVIYLRIIASDGKKYWLGFAGNKRDTPGKTKYEYTTHSFFRTQNPVIQENVLEIFRLGYPELSCYPVRIDNIRLRGSDNDPEQITFTYKIT
jgi:hypothetical protein